MRLFLPIFFCLYTFFSIAQFTSADVKYFYGSGPKTCYFVIDFKDGTDDRSYAFGFHYDPSLQVTTLDMLQQLQEAEPAFRYQQSGGFLDHVIYNSHSSEDGDDWWSLWAKTEESPWGMAGWLSGGLVAEDEWFGLSYGFSNPEPEEPFTPLPAYHSLWFNSSQITDWVGTGNNQSVVVIDFGQSSYAFGVKYATATITYAQALTIIQDNYPNFNFTGTTSVETVNYRGESGISSITNPCSYFGGTNLSNWRTSSFNSTLSDGQWLGLSFGTRRPFTPTVTSSQESVLTIEMDTNQSFCENISLKTTTIPFVISDFYFASNNVFTAYLSDENGNFGTETIIGTETAFEIGNQSINVTLPQNILVSNNYKVKVKSSNPVEEFILTNNWLIHPTTPVNITADPIDASVMLGESITLTSSSATSYAWSPSHLFQNATAGTVSFTPNEDVIVDLLVMDNNGCSNNGQISITVLPNNVSVSTLSDIQLSVYPNPSKEYFIIENYSGKITILDLNGRKIYEDEYTNVEKIQTQQFANGTYFIDVNQSSPIKLVVQH